MDIAFVKDMVSGKDRQKIKDNKKNNNRERVNHI